MTTLDMKQLYDVIQDIAWEFGPQGFDGTCCGNLTFVEFMTLKRIYIRREIPINGLAAELGITKGGTSKIVDRLEEKGFAVRKKTREDGRICCAAATREGEKILTTSIDHYAHMLEHVLKTEDSENIIHIVQAIKRLGAALKRNRQEHLTEAADECTR